MSRKLTGAVLISTILAITPALAEVERILPDFTFKRVPIPSAGSSSRITVQIDPNAPRLGPVYADPEPEPVVAAGAIALPQPSGLEWFWTTVPTALAAQGPVRFQKAIEQLNNPPSGKGVPSPRLQALQNIASAHGRRILIETVGTSVSPALVLAVISVESAGRTDAVSSAGATGLMQLMPDTATRFGVDDSTNAAQNIKGGVAYLEWLLDHFDNDPLLALAGYNAGEGNVRRYEGVPPFSETRAYVPKVLAAWQVAKGLCQTPPELITDACVFNVNGI
ncbi:lytic transglycosylase domain-containing protein [Yoonia algicola]|uniref:Lytic transglycosylase domain-containing protein n=1 Tax=Yoonia algicola TaxID=3137368 RepID=A0AAN0NEX0_9RHOB